MQNSIVKEFTGNPQVRLALLNPGDSHSETLAWTQHFWDNNYLRGSFLYDNDGSVDSLYEQPATGLPFGRGFIIDQQGNVDLPFFGHNPQMVIARIYELLEDSPPTAPQNLAAFVTGADLELMWSPVTADVWGNPMTVNHYRVYRGQEPYFTCDGEHLLGETADCFYTVAGAMSQPGGFFKVTAGYP